MLRWFLLHWLIFHLLLTVFFFVISVVFFSVEIRMRKLLGVIPVLASFFIIYCWSKVYKLLRFICTSFLYKTFQSLYKILSVMITSWQA